MNTIFKYLARSRFNLVECIGLCLIAQSEGGAFQILLWCILLIVISSALRVLADEH